MGFHQHQSCIALTAASGEEGRLSPPSQLGRGPFHWAITNFQRMDGQVLLISCWTGSFISGVTDEAYIASSLPFSNSFVRQSQGHHQPVPHLLDNQYKSSRCLRTSMMSPLAQNTILPSPFRLMRNIEVQPQHISPRCHQSFKARCNQPSIVMTTSLPMRI